MGVSESSFISALLMVVIYGRNNQTQILCKGTYTTRGGRVANICSLFYVSSNFKILPPFHYFKNAPEAPEILVM